MGYRSRERFSWPKYVPVAERKAKAEKHIQTLNKKGEKCSPIIIEGRGIAKTFWGKSWCDNLERYSDYSNRLPRGRTYVRNGSIIDLKIIKGQILARVMGSSLYSVSIEIKPIPTSDWNSIVQACSGKIDSLVELLQGKFSKSVMEILTRKGEGLFPKPQEISMDCSCPDFAVMCKHVAAVLYGIGASLDSKPEDLFVLRHVNHIDLISSAASETLLQPATDVVTIQDDELEALFGIELEQGKNKKSKSPKSNEEATTKKASKNAKDGKREG